VRELLLFPERDPAHEAFLEFHRANPRVYELFVQYTFEAIRAGCRHFSAYSVRERIRWNRDVETRGRDGFKLNNNLTPYYARKFMHDHPAQRGIFATREARADEGAA